MHLQLDSEAKVPKSPKKPVERISISVPETAEALGISTRYAWRLVKTGVIPVFRLGSRTFVSIEELKQLTSRTAAAVDDVAS